MSKSITIRLVPDNKVKIYKPAPDYADLYILMNKLHFHTVNEALEEEAEEKVSELELEKNTTKETLNSLYREESSLTILQDSLEKTNRALHKELLSRQNLEDKARYIEELNKIIQELPPDIQKDLTQLDLKNADNLIGDIQKNLEILKEKKSKINDKTSKLISYISRVETLQENINSSNADIDSLEVALKNLYLS